MLKQWVLLLSFAGLVLPNDLQDEPSTQLPFSSTTNSPLIEITSQKPYQDVPLEAQVLQTANGDQTSGISSNANVFTSRLYHIVSGNPDVIRAINAPVTEKKVTVERHQHVTVHPPTANRVSSIPVPVVTQPLRQYVQTALKPAAIRYISAPVGYSQVYQNPDQESVTFQQPSGAIVTSEPRPTPASFGYHSNVLYVSAPTGAVQPPPVATPIALYPTYHQSQGIVNSFGSQHVYAPTSQTGQHYETVTDKPSSGDYLTSPVALSPSSVQHIQTNVIPQTVQYILAPVKQLKKIFNKPIKTVTIKAHKSNIAHPPAPLFNPPVPFPSTPAIGHNAITINHHGIPHVNYASSSTDAKPIPVPVIYNTEDIPSAQFIEVTKQIPSAPAIVNHQAPIPVAQLIPVPVAYPNSNAYVRYDHKSRAHVSNTPHVFPEHGSYSRAVFSPASEVSSVRFSGHGIEYGW